MNKNKTQINEAKLRRLVENTVTRFVNEKNMIKESFNSNQFDKFNRWMKSHGIYTDNVLHKLFYGNNEAVKANELTDDNVMVFYNDPMRAYNYAKGLSSKGIRGGVILAYASGKSSKNGRGFAEKIVLDPMIDRSWFEYDNDESAILVFTVDTEQQDTNRDQQFAKKERYRPQTNNRWESGMKDSFQGRKNYHQGSPEYKKQMDNTTNGQNGDYLSRNKKHNDAVRDFRRKK